MVTGIKDEPNTLHWRWMDMGFWRVMDRWAAEYEAKRISNKASRDRKKERLRSANGSKPDGTG